MYVQKFSPASETAFIHTAQPAVPQPEPAPKPEPAPAMQFTQVQSADPDDDLDMEGPPIVGSYSIPEADSAVRRQEPKQRPQGGGSRKVLIFAAGGIVALAVVHKQSIE